MHFYLKSESDSLKSIKRICNFTVFWPGNEKQTDGHTDNIGKEHTKGIKKKHADTENRLLRVESSEQSLFAQSVQPK